MGLIQPAGVMDGTDSPIDGADLPAGYEITWVPAQGKDKESKICFELLIKSRIEFDQWLADFSQKNNVIWRKLAGDKKRKGKKKETLEVSLACHHAKMGQTGKKTTSTK